MPGEPRNGRREPREVAGAKRHAAVETQKDVGRPVCVEIAADQGLPPEIP